MSEPIESRIWEVLRDIRFKGMSRDIVSFGFVESAALDEEGRARVKLKIRTHDAASAQELRGEVAEKLSAIADLKGARVEIDIQTPPDPREASRQAIAPDASLIPEVRRVIAVASGKGGVGKSTVAVNLAVSLARQGHSVGLLDADIYGPSMPMMMGIHDKRPRVSEDGKTLLPFDRHGVAVMSLGVILDVDTPVIWRGPMVMKAIEQLLRDVAWGALDYLIVDLPPGTGDAQLTLTQKVPLSGAVIVTTPQDVALIDARKGLAMFQKVNVPVLGLIENMSAFVCPHCGEATEIFKRGGGARTALELGCPFLGSVPLDPAIAEGGDAGVPISVSQPDGAHAEAFAKLARAVVEASSVERPRLAIH